MNLSLCIPCVYDNHLTESSIRQRLDKFNLGSIRRVDIVPQPSSSSSQALNRVYIHFDSWNENTLAQTVRQKLLDGKEIKLVYDNPWYWRVSLNRSNVKKKK